tara:strand:- start:1640 stop:2251 length:612 start_codon:yes stop_codon:yes gene_type:complete
MPKKANPVEKKSTAKKTVSKKKTEPVEPVVELTTTEKVVEQVAPATSDGDSDLLGTEFMGFMAKLQQLGSTISALKTEFRTLEKKATRSLKTAQKEQAKKKRKAGNRAPSGFTKPSLISNELASFLEKPQGTEMARTEVTREINAYIRAHNLQDKDNGRKINADNKLSTLLKLKKGDELTYFNLQRYMSPHFAKASKPAETTK